MRPPEFTGGNATGQVPVANLGTGFNEAAGIHRRKRKIEVKKPAKKAGFNEAAGIHRRKHAVRGASASA